MTAEAPERPRDRGDLFDRLPGPVGGPAWLDAIIDSVRSPATADGLRRALDARLGTAEEREAKRRLLLPRLPSHRSLLSDLAGAITIEGGADHMVRILRAAITGGTSRELLERDLTPLLELMAAAPAPGPRTDGAGRADPRPERARPEARPPAAPRAERQTAPLRDRSDPTRRSGFDPDGPFRVRDPSDMRDQLDLPQLLVERVRLVGLEEFQRPLQGARAVAQRVDRGAGGSGERLTRELWDRLGADHLEGGRGHRSGSLIGNGIVPF